MNKKALNKSIIFIFILTVFFITPIQSQNYQNTDNTLQMIENQMQKFSKEEQIKKYQLFINIMTNAIKTNNKQQEKNRYLYILEFFENKFNQLKQTKIQTQTGNMDNINHQTIQDKRLILHNQERSSL